MAHLHSSRVLRSSENNNPQLCQTMNITMSEKTETYPNHAKLPVRMQVYCMPTCERQWLSKWLPSQEWVQQHPKEVMFSWDELRICTQMRRKRPERAEGTGVRFWFQAAQGSLRYLEMDGRQDHPLGASWVLGKYYVALPLQQLLVCHSGIWSCVRENCDFPAKGKESRRC